MKKINLVNYVLGLVGLAVTVYVVGYSFKMGSNASKNKLGE